ncbi:RNA polymerase sigma factor, partial [Enterobacter hormaechei]
PSPGAADRLQRVEEEIAAEDIISTLPADSREVLLLYYREGQRSQQVADLLGLSDAAVRKRLSRARTLVRDGLLQRFGEFARSSAPSA